MSRIGEVFFHYDAIFLVREVLAPVSHKPDGASHSFCAFLWVSNDYRL